MARRFPTFASRLTTALCEMVDTDLGPTLIPDGRRFTNPDELAAHLSEGALLNVTTLGSYALSVPVGEYMVWMTDAGHTMLVPVAERQRYREVFEGGGNEVEIYTPRLLQAWDGGVERILAERQNVNWQDVNQGRAGSLDAHSHERSRRSGRRNEPQLGVINAINNSGKSETAIANDMGVNVSLVSRLKKKPGKTERRENSRGRYPSAETMAGFCDATDVSPEEAWPKLFAKESYQFDDNLVESGLPSVQTLDKPGEKGGADRKSSAIGSSTSGAIAGAAKQQHQREQDLAQGQKARTRKAGQNLKQLSSQVSGMEQEVSRLSPGISNMKAPIGAADHAIKDLEKTFPTM